MISQEEELNKVPIFVHSLWRTGSTYFFDKFRHSPFNYICYKEPIHEEVLWHKDNPEFLIQDGFLETVKLLRHPKLDKPYLQELYEIRDVWKDKITKNIIYDDSFGSVSPKETKSYLESIILSSKGRPVIFECRTPYRLSTIKNLLGGIHIYLWRNPWDNWWSYKANHYFNLANLLIINAPSCPTIIKKLRTEINFIEFHNDNIGEEFNFFNTYGKLSSENSYFVFFILWCLGLIECIKSADFNVNIDALSYDKNYRDFIESIFRNKNIGGLNFKDCVIPKKSYCVEDVKFFKNIEDKAINLLLESGYDNDIAKLIRLRAKYEPQYLRNFLNELPIDSLVSEIKILRNIVIRLESELHDSIKMEKMESDFSISEVVKIKHNYGLIKKESNNYNIPILLGSYNEYNIVHLSGIIYVIPQNIGELDLQKEEDRKNPDIIAIHDINELDIYLKKETSSNL